MLWRSLGFAGRRTACASLLLAVTPTVSGDPIGPTGPDAFGHTGDDIPFNLRDIQATGTALVLTDDDSELVPIGFEFSFYGNTFDTVFVASNGFQTDSDPIWEGEGPGRELKGSTPEGGIFYGVTKDGKTISRALEQSLIACGSEPDPERTARIAFAADYENEPETGYMGIVIRPRTTQDGFADADELKVEKLSFNVPGLFRMIGTYGVHRPAYHDARPPELTELGKYSRQVRLEGTTPEFHVRLPGGASAFPGVAGYASADEIAPGVFAALDSGDHMVERQLFRGKVPAAVLAVVAVPGVKVSPVELDVLVRETIVPEEPDDLGHGNLDLRGPDPGVGRRFKLFLQLGDLDPGLKIVVEV